MLTYLVDEEIIPSLEVTEEITVDKSSMTGEVLLQLKHFRNGGEGKRESGPVSIERVGAERKRVEFSGKTC